MCVVRYTAAHHGVQYVFTHRKYTAWFRVLGHWLVVGLNAVGGALGYSVGGGESIRVCRMRAET